MKSSLRGIVLLRTLMRRMAGIDSRRSREFSPGISVLRLVREGLGLGRTRCIDSSFFKDGTI